MAMQPDQLTPGTELTDFAPAGLELEAEGKSNDASLADAFDRLAANLADEWRDDGLGYAGHAWEDQPILYRVSYLADFAGAMGIPFERYVVAARHTRLGCARKRLDRGPGMVRRA